jgi:threonine/homoserine/homoserine lactone efflux protein
VAVAPVPGPVSQIAGDLGHDPLLNRGRFVILGTLFLLVGLVFGTIIGLLSGRLGNTLRSRKWVTKLLDRISGTVLAGLGLRLALNDNRP